MDCPVFDGPSLVGYMADEDVRDIVRKGQGKMRGVGTRRRRLLLNKEAVSRVRSLCLRDAGGAAISSTQREELYQGFRKDHTDGPVTKVITVVKRPGVTIGRDILGREIFGLVPWRENDRFPRRRFNPDKIAPALFRSERDYRAAQATA